MKSIDRIADINDFWKQIFYELHAKRTKGIAKCVVGVRGWSKWGWFKKEEKGEYEE